MITFLTDAIAVLIGLSVAGFVTYMLFCWDEMAQKREERTREINAARLDDKHGGSWGYDKRKSEYFDYMTDRRIKSEDLDQWL